MAVGDSQKPQRGDLYYFWGLYNFFCEILYPNLFIYLKLKVHPEGQEAFPFFS
jgi:hypothetical protein